MQETLIMNLTDRLKRSSNVAYRIRLGWVRKGNETTISPLCQLFIDMQARTCLCFRHKMSLLKK